MNASKLYRHLPHSGSMCLLDRVESWDEARICCSTATHRCARNPLRRGEVLPGLCALEYAAQALALHAVLKRPRQASQERFMEAYIVSSKRLEFGDDDLACVPGLLLVSAELVVWHESAAGYTVTVSADHRCLLAGDLGVVLS